MIMKCRYRSLDEAIKHLDEEVSQWGPDRGEADILDFLLELRRFRKLSGLRLEPDDDRDRPVRSPRRGVLDHLADGLDREIEDVFEDIFPGRRRRR